MPRRITVECSEGHREEIVIGSNQKIPRCACKKVREVVWVKEGPGFRVKGLTKRF